MRAEQRIEFDVGRRSISGGAREGPKPSYKTPPSLPRSQAFADLLRVRRRTAARERSSVNCVDDYDVAPSTRRPHEPGNHSGPDVRM